MRVLVTGAKGLLGTEVLENLECRGHEPVPASRAELDIADPESVAKVGAGLFGDLDWIVNCAAYTAVDRAESEEQLATEVNGFGPSYLAQAIGSIQPKLLHISTDFVFDGAASEPYTEDSPVNPLGAYGRSKLIGEQALAGNPKALTVRTSWLFGPAGQCFPRTMLRLHREGKPIRVVADQFGTPTYTPHLARVLVDLIERDPFPGLYHAAGPHVMSWHDFASLVLKTCVEREVEVTPISTAEFPTPARRPPYSALSTARVQNLGIAPMPEVAKAVKEFCRSLGKENLP